ncbi:hypothetical protein TSUD_188000 [Trifolium subterraneum]|uniref:CCHC-type domain-containing protein n=1 Tax=Trifolium subterraneum TaxID=3900 RepID=A0A2Z6PG04_TRISU|nr:hypothetical protein TSUD_188000 [Trifolium subterraneum]
MVMTVDTRGGDEVVGDVASVGAVNEVMEAYFEALNEITQEMNGNRGDEDADEEDSNVNVDNSVDDCNGEEDNEDNGYSEGVEFDGDESDYDYLTDELNRLNSKYIEANCPQSLHGPVEVDNIMNPHCSRSKGGGQSANTTTGRRRRPSTCGGCSEPGHNIRSCPIVAANNMEFAAGSSLQSLSVRLSDDN